MTAIIHDEGLLEIMNGSENLNKLMIESNGPITITLPVAKAGETFTIKSEGEIIINQHQPNIGNSYTEGYVQAVYDMQIKARTEENSNAELFFKEFLSNFQNTYCL